MHSSKQRSIWCVPVHMWELTRSMNMAVLLHVHLQSCKGFHSQGPFGWAAETILSCKNINGTADKQFVLWPNRNGHMIGLIYQGTLQCMWTHTVVPRCSTVRPSASSLSTPVALVSTCIIISYLLQHIGLVWCFCSYLRHFPVQLLQLNTLPHNNWATGNSPQTPSPLAYVP